MTPPNSQYGSEAWSGADGAAFNNLREDRHETARMLQSMSLAAGAHASSQRAIREEGLAAEKQRQADAYNSAIAPVYEGGGSYEDVLEKKVEAEREFLRRNPRAAGVVAEEGAKVDAWLNSSNSTFQKSLALTNQKLEAQQKNQELEFTHRNMDDILQVRTDELFLAKEKQKKDKASFELQDVNDLSGIQQHIIKSVANMSNDPEARAFGVRILNDISSQADPVEAEKIRLTYQPILDGYKGLSDAMEIHGQALNDVAPEIESVWQIAKKKPGPKMANLVYEFLNNEETGKNKDRSVGELYTENDLSPAERIQILATARKDGILSGNDVSTLGKVTLHTQGFIESQKAFNELRGAIKLLDGEGDNAKSRGEAALITGDILGRVQRMEAQRLSNLKARKIEVDIERVEQWTANLKKQNELMGQDPTEVQAAVLQMVRNQVVIEDNGQFIYTKEDPVTGARVMGDKVLNIQNVADLIGLDAFSKKGGSGGSGGRKSFGNDLDGTGGASNDAEKASGQPLDSSGKPFAPTPKGGDEQVGKPSEPGMD